MPDMLELPRRSPWIDALIEGAKADDITAELIRRLEACDVTSAIALLTKDAKK